MELVTLINMPIERLEDGTIIATENIYARYPNVDDVLCREFARGEIIELDIEKFRYRVQQKWMYVNGGEHDSY